MKPNELIEKLQKLPSDNNIALVEGVTNEHIYDLTADYIHISGDENYFEISFELTFKMILKWLKMKFYWKFKKKLN